LSCEESEGDKEMKVTSNVMFFMQSLKDVVLLSDGVA
jgi:hypothetical protein